MRGFWVGSFSFLSPALLLLHSFLTPLFMIILIIQITVMREAPAYAGFYAGFENTKRTFRTQLFPDLPKDQNLPVWALMISGSVGGICNWLACYPIGQFLVTPKRDSICHSAFFIEIKVIAV